MRTLFFVAVIDILGFGILIPLVPYMADRFGVTPALITPILGVYSLCQLIAAPLWGRLSDRYGRRPILMSSLAGACVSYLLLGFATSVAGLLVARGGLWHRVLMEAELSALTHTPVVGSRTLDILHVADAKLIGATDFCTFDARQSSLAVRVGLIPVSP